MKTPKAAKRTDPDLLRLKMAMWQLGIKPGQLAKRCGMPRQKVYDLLHGNDRKWEARRAVNVALGMRVFTKAGIQLPAPLPPLQERLGFTVHRDEAEDVATLKLWMIQQNVSVGTLARKAKIDPRVLSNVLIGNNTNFPPRQKINKATGQTFFLKPGHNKR